MDTVLVTGISGYIASHVAAKLVAKGYAVRGTVRNKAKGRRIIGAMQQTGVDVSNMSLVEADLGSDEGWRDAVKGCRFIQHVASPFPLEAPSDREALVPEARAGAQRVLENGFSASVERIVMTSSLHAIMNQPDRGAEKTFTENDWSDPEWKALAAYPVSKTRAELSAWAYVEQQHLREKLITVQPGIVLGPDPYANGGASLGAIRDMMNGEFPMMPKIAYPVADVRDVASVHVAAMTAKGAGGRRLIAAGETVSFMEMANIIRERFPAAKVPKQEAPSFILKIMALFDDRLKGIVADLGHTAKVDAAYVCNLTGVMPRPAKESILASAHDLIVNGEVELD